MAQQGHTCTNDGLQDVIGLTSSKEWRSRTAELQIRWWCMAQEVVDSSKNATGPSVKREDRIGGVE